MSTVTENSHLSLKQTWVNYIFTNYNQITIITHSSTNYNYNYKKISITIS